MRGGKSRAPTVGGGVNLFAVTSLSSSRSWAAGLSGGGDGPTNGVILQWSGSAWTRAPIPALRGDDGGLFGLAATSRSNAWAVGWESAGSNNASVPGNSGTPEIVILHWKGGTWVPVTKVSSATIDRRWRAIDDNDARSNHNIARAGDDNHHGSAFHDDASNVGRGWCVPNARKCGMGYRSGFVRRDQRLRRSCSIQFL